MKIKGLYPESFGRLQHGAYTFSEGINLIKGPNEAGKTTLRQFLTAMLFGWEKGRAKDDPYKRYKPWDNAGAYGGAMELEYDGREYRVERDFLADGGLTVRQYPSLREVPSQTGLMNALGSSLTRAGYENTVMVPQGGAMTEEALAELYANYIANVRMSKDRAVDVAGALAELAEQKKVLAKRNRKEKLAEDRERLTELTEELAELDRKAAEREELTAEKAKLAEELGAISEDPGLAEEHAFQTCVREYERYVERREAFSAREEELRQRCEQREQVIRDIPDLTETDEQERKLDALLRRKEREVAAAEAVSAECREREESLRRRLKKIGWLWIPALVMMIAAAGVVIYAFGREEDGWKLGRAYGICAAVFFLIVFAAGLTVRRRLLARLRKIQARREAASRPTELLRSLTEQIAAMPTEHELHERRDRAVAGRAREEALAEQIAEREAAQEKEAEELAECERQLLTEFGRFEEIEELDSAAVDRIRGHVLARSVQLQNRREELQRRNETLTGRIAQLTQQIEDSESVSEELFDTQARIAEGERKLAEDDTELAALTLAEERIRTISGEIHDSFGIELNRAVSEYAEALTDGAYRKLSADEKLTVRTSGRSGAGTAAEHTSSKAREIGSLSTGTAEQLMLALRLAVTEKMYGGEHLPLVFDDSFVYYDTVRLRRTLRRLAERGEQVLLFTCGEREEQILAEEGIPYTVVSM